MSKKDKIFMPSSQGGLVRYFDEERTRFRIKPGYVIAFIVVVAIIELLLHFA